MLKMEIRFNDSQITADSRYTPAAICDAVDRAFSKYHFRKEILSDGTICYYGNGQSRDYGIFGRLITTLKDKDWFVPYLVKWLWYNSDDGDDEMDFTVEDVLYHYARRESAA